MNEYFAMLCNVPSVYAVWSAALVSRLLVQIDNINVTNIQACIRQAHADARKGNPFAAQQAPAGRIGPVSNRHVHAECIAWVFRQQYLAELMIGRIYALSTSASGSQAQ